MSGGFVVDHAALRRMAARLDDVTDGIAHARHALADAPDAGQSSGELADTLEELRGRVQDVVDSLRPLAPTVRAVADDFATTDDDAAVDLRVKQSMPAYYDQGRP